MAILNIETSGKICSVALTSNGGVDFHIESESEMNHASCLAPFVEKCLKEIERKGDTLEAVAVSIGPGSYTGLRIGLSLAKGICFSRNIPLIGINTLKILAVKGMFSSFEWEGNELLVPMIDARRMEVYTAVYNFKLEDVISPQPLILTEDSFSELLNIKKLIFIGDGVEKAKKLIKSENCQWLDYKNPLAIDMTALSDLAYQKKDFLDLAYSTPQYLKEYQATTPKNKVLGGLSK